jgi:D-serine deaminase-like pyridoxal phosphate-dependent protein
MTSPSYAEYRDLFRGREMPFAFVNMDLLDENIRQLLARAGEKTIRIASKSVRCTWMLRYLLDFSPKMQGLMCFTASEAVWLSQQGFDDLLIAYPFWHKDQVKAVCEELKKGKKIILMVDSPDQVAHLQTLAKENDTVIPLCLDLDMSSKLPGIHFGVYRSPLKDEKGALVLNEAITNASHLKLTALMGYEAQIAGLGDRMPGQGLKNIAIGFLKKRSIREVAKRRAAVVNALTKAGAQLEIVNGGGTGSMESTRVEAAVTEITVGSGFYNSHLFDYYSNFQHLPAAGYAIGIVRKPEKDIYTCQGGGYVSSGSVGKERLPLPWLPVGAKLHPNEGAGEVQTPIVYKGAEKLSPGDPIFMRHSKAGELCERFNSLLLVRGGKVVDEIPTYRGEGQCFL